MAKIISIIPKRHLVTYKVSEKNNHRACGYHDYKVFVETDNGVVFVLSAEEWDINCFTAIELLEKKQKDDVREFDRTVTIDDFNDFVRASMEDGTTPLKAITHVLFNLKESGCQCSGDVEKLVKDVYPNIP